MLKFLQMIVRRAPLLFAILVSWILLSLIAWTGRGRGYKQYEEEFIKTPSVSLVMRGIHDRVFPWSDTASRGEGSSAEDREGDNLTKENAGTDKDTGEAGGQTSGQENKEARPGGETQNEAGEKEGEDRETQEEESGSGAGEDKKAGGDKEGSGKEQETQKDSGTEAQGETGKESGSQKKENQKSLTVPASSCSPVVKAKDYGVAQERYLAPADAVYNTDTEGLFAPDGVYYSLQQVDDSYFSDALFVGDSRTVGLLEYGGMETFTSFLARESTTVYDLFSDSDKMEYTPKGKKMVERTLKDLLSKASFRKIYLSVGVNELGIPDTMDYYREFRSVISKIHKLQPHAIIYIQGIMHVSKDKSRTDPVFNNTAIVQRNQAIASLANGRNIFYIDMNGELCDKDGNLRDDLTGDGIHLKASACPLWHTFLKKNAILVPD